MAISETGEGGLDPKMVLSLVNEAKQELLDDLDDFKVSTESSLSHLQSELTSTSERINS